MLVRECISGGQVTNVQAHPKVANNWINICNFQHENNQKVKDTLKFIKDLKGVTLSEELR